MASLRPGTRGDGSTYVQVLYRLDGKQSSTSFEDLASAKKFQKVVDKFGHTMASPRRPWATSNSPDQTNLETQSGLPRNFSRSAGRLTSSGQRP
jgi:CHASE1-domain containing sensor protein